MLSIIYPLASIGSLVCFIMVLIPLFKTKGALHGILGILCAIYTFIWGWMNAKTLNLSKIMLIWTICLVVSMLTGAAATAAAVKMMQEQGAAGQPTTPPAP